MPSAKDRTEWSKFLESERYKILESARYKIKEDPIIYNDIVDIYLEASRYQIYSGVSSFHTIFVPLLASVFVFFGLASLIYVGSQITLGGGEISLYVPALLIGALALLISTLALSINSFLYAEAVDAKRQAEKVNESILAKARPLLGIEETDEKVRRDSTPS